MQKEKRSIISSIKYALVAFLATVYLYLTGITTRTKRQIGKELKNLEKKRQNFIYAIWHNQQAFLTYAYRHKKACALVSMSKDGEYIARILKNFGTKSVRGSTSKGGIKAVLKLIGSAKQGYHPVLTPDGPRGPIHTVGLGIIFLAQKINLPIIPIACALKRKIVFKSWDKFELPLPFGKSAIVEGKPIKVGGADDLTQKACELKAELDRISETAKKLLSRLP
jgi:lysophospholipid acyltransferase (LPLAT)-like uncharacterized protein